MNEDSTKLLMECNMGCKSATNSMEQIMPFIKDKELEKIVERYNNKHISYADKCHELLNENDEDEKDPPAIASAFAWFGTEVKLMVDDKTEKIADILVDGCNMGIKSLSKYINQYDKAEKKIIDLARELIDIEESFMKELLNYV